MKNIFSLRRAFEPIRRNLFQQMSAKIINHIISHEELDSISNNHSIIDCILFHTKLIAVEFYLTGASSIDINNIVKIFVIVLKTKGTNKTFKG